MIDRKLFTLFLRKIVFQSVTKYELFGNKIPIIFQQVNIGFCKQLRKYFVGRIDHYISYTGKSIIVSLKV